MKTYIKTGVTLLLICAVCASLCALVNSVTAPQIAANMAAANAAAAASISGGMTPGEAKTAGDANYPYVVTIADLTNADGSVGGYLLELKSGGYGGPMTIMASYNLDGSLIGAKLTNNSETAGLGKKAEEDWYMAMFTGKGGATPIPASKNDLSDSEAAGISGATITFNGVSAAILQGSVYVKEAVK